MMLCNEYPKTTPFEKSKWQELNNMRNESLEATEAFGKKTKKQKRKKSRLLENKLKK